MIDHDNEPEGSRKIWRAYDLAYDEVNNISTEKRDWENTLTSLSLLHRWITTMPQSEEADLDTYLGLYRKNVRDKINSDELKSKLPGEPWEYSKGLYKIYREWLGLMIDLLQRSGIPWPSGKETVTDYVGIKGKVR